MVLSDLLGGLYEETGLFEGPSILWPAVATEVRDPSPMWAEFAEAVGPEVLRRAYGWDRPRAAAPGERVWVFRDPDGRPVAWSSVRPDPTIPVAWLALGVWPAYQRQGWADRVRAWTAAQALRDWPWVLVEIRRENTEHLRRWLERPPEGWIWVGSLDVPSPGSIFFGRAR
jgi:hypothetical protein